MTAATAPAARWALRLLTAACLAVDAYIHLKLASTRPPASGPGGISQGALFYAQGGVAILAALLVVFRGTRAAFGFAFLVAASALAAVLTYRYIDVGALGPLPDMYEPAWYATKITTTIAEAIAVLTAVAGFLAARHGQSPVPGATRGARWRESRIRRDPDRSLR
jgi:hypothetical protein